MPRLITLDMTQNSTGSFEFAVPSGGQLDTQDAYPLSGGRGDYGYFAGGGIPLTPKGGFGGFYPTTGGSSRLSRTTPIKPGTDPLSGKLNEVDPSAFAKDPVADAPFQAPLQWGNLPIGGSTPDYYPDGSWTVACTGTPPGGLTPNQKLGIVPGSPSINFSGCDVSIAGTANRAWGTTVPAGSTVLQKVRSGAAWPNQNGAPYYRATHPSSPAAAAIPFGPQMRAGPVPAPPMAPAVPTRMETPTTTPTRPRAPGSQDAVNVTFTNDRKNRPVPVPPPVDRTDPADAPASAPDQVPPRAPVPPGTPPVDHTPHPPLPPPPGTRQKKFKLGKGGLIGDVFGTITEILDFAECLAKAAGAKHHMSMQNTSAFIAENFDVTDPHMVADAIKCIALSNLSDIAFGKLSSKASKAFGGTPWSVSPRGVGIQPAPSPFSSYGHSERMK